jgi:hypothetical protein
MQHPKIWRWIVLLTLAVTLFITFDVAVRASPPPPDGNFQVDISKTAQALSGDMQLNAVGDTLEVFTNTWSYNTLGMVYDPTRDHLRYVHESQSNSHNPTIYDVEPSTPHTVVNSFALSSLNTGWPWELDNCTGAGYDIDTDTYFLVDYNGDLANADDNIVEVDVNGNILNAWEMDDEVGSNDSADGSEIDSVIDIAVVPGTPTRYFVTAAYDQAVVYEVVLTKTGTLWTPNSWATVMTYTGAISDTFTDNLGIDYDAQNDRLYHSGWHTTTILVTELDMTTLKTFDCPGAGGYNSGVAFIEGSNPPEIWVTDFSSDKTTRCEAIGAGPSAIKWDKWIDGASWDPHVTHTYETLDTFEVVDVITATQPVQLMERWNPQHLELLTYTTEPSVGVVVPGPNGQFLEWNLPPAPDVVTMTKTFRVKPSTWTSTMLSETLRLPNGAVVLTRPVTIKKEVPALSLNSSSPATATAGSVTTYTLTYGNAGGYENDVKIQARFPITAPIIHALPYPTHLGNDKAVWELGDLAKGTVDQIEVFVRVASTVQPLQAVEIDNRILNHMNQIKHREVITYHVEEPPSVEWMWEKFAIVNDGEPRPPVSVTVQTSDTLRIVDVITASDHAEVLEFWDPAHLELLHVVTETGFIHSLPGGGMIWEVPGGSPTPVAITKTFHVSPCTWLDTVLWEEFWVGPHQVDQRPVGIQKRPANLWINSTHPPLVNPGAQSTFVLTYGNAGGFENGAWITSTFPAEATFIGYEADPPVPVNDDPQGRWAEWDVGSLADGGVGTITVTVDISPGLPLTNLPPIHNYIRDHADVEHDWTVVHYEVRPPRWDKYVNGEPWRHPVISLTVETSDTFQVVDVITGAFDTELREFWNPERLELTELAFSEGEVFTQDNHLVWTVPYTASPVTVLTKTFRVKGQTWTDSLLQEELWVTGDFWRERPVLLLREPPDLHLTASYPSEAVFPGERVTYTLLYENLGGYESGAWITTTFPISAPLVHAEPVPDAEDPLGQWAYWDLGPLDANESGTITVSVALTETLAPYEVVHTYNYIYDQVDVIYGQVDIEHDWAPVSYTLKPVEPTWEKEIWIGDDGPHQIEQSPFTVPPDESVTIVDRVEVAAGAPISYTLTESWGDVLTLAEMSATGGNILTTTQTLAWQGHDLEANTQYVLTKTFHVAGSDWDTAFLTETLIVVNADPEEHIVNLEFDRGEYNIYLPLVVRNYEP